MAVCLDQITKYYGDKAVLQNFSLTFPERGIVCLYGASGCGKTTLLHILAGLDHAYTGSISGMEGMRCSMQFQEDRLLNWRNLEENIRLVNPDVDLDGLLQTVELDGLQKVMPQALSGGMRRRAALARALGAESDILLLDEPFKGLDFALCERLYPRIYARTEGKLTILVTHDASAAALLGDLIYQLDGPPLYVTRKIPAPLPFLQRLALPEYREERRHWLEETEA
ncbi:MAG TPA: ATP-binding cassette domain-containing protein [Firmicutes bacterium]|nr:ATP-binding cassette domain-containing protein [Bacillota bacterium]